jgi:tryptophan-rich sensory protein
MAEWFALKEQRRKLMVLYPLQWLLNISWNPIFFYYKQPILALIAIVLLLILVLYTLFSNRNVLKGRSVLLLPYALWMVVATSLNAYIVIHLG